MARVEVIIVNYNGREYLPDCCASLRAQIYRDFRVTFVDNGSGDGSADWVASEWPEAHLLRLSKNIGFAAGNNAAIVRSHTELIALLNSDTRPEASWLSALVAAADSNEWAGFFASRIVRADDPNKIDSAGDVFRTDGVAAKRGEGMPSHLYTTSQEMFGACAAAALYRREIFTDVGLFDESFFCYDEDVDLSFRARLGGYRCLYVPDAVVLHHVGGTSKKAPRSRLRWTRRNSLETVLKNMPGPLLARHGPRILAHYVLGDMYHLCSGSFAGVILARWDNLTRLAATLRKRKQVQAARRVDYRQISRQLAEPCSVFRALAPRLRRWSRPLGDKAQRRSTGGDDASRDSALLDDRHHTPPDGVSVQRRDANQDFGPVDRPLPGAYTQTALVSIVFLNYNGGAYTLEAVDALGNQSCRSFECIVVDNGSTDDSLERIVCRMRHVGLDPKVVQLATNHHYAGGMNAGISQAKGVVVVPLNSDVYLDVHFVEALEVAVRERLEDGVGTLVGDEYHWDWQSEGLTPHLRSQGVGLLRRLGVRAWIRGEHHESQLLGPSGCAPPLCRAALEEVRLPNGDYYDSSFVAFGEDIDLLLRLRTRGYRPVYVPGLRFWHIGSASYSSGTASLVAKPTHLLGQILSNYWRIWRRLPKRSERAAAFPLVAAHQSAVLCRLAMSGRWADGAAALRALLQKIEQLRLDNTEPYSRSPSESGMYIGWI
jgi:GT2 family glycosyltransferase